MGMFWDSDDTKAVGDASVQVTSGLRHLFTGDIPPEIIAEMDRLDANHITERWKADAKIPWYLSSRAIVLILHNVNIIVMYWLISLGLVTSPQYMFEAYMGLVVTINVAFFGSKGVEYIRAGKSP